MDHITRRSNLLYRVELNVLKSGVENIRGNCGYFYEYSLKSLEELAAVVNDKFQTLTQFGMDSVELQKFVLSNHLSGIDRIVSVGQAMDIGPVWDGYDLVRMLSRVVYIE